MRTPGYYALALYAQGGAPAAGAGEANTDVIYLVTHSNPFSQAVLAILLLFSAVSWGVVLYKFWQFGRAARQLTILETGDRAPGVEADLVVEVGDRLTRSAPE